MNPTQAQLDTRLNPTATNVYIPQDGIFTAVGGNGDVLYIRSGNTIKTFDITSLLTPEERQSSANRGNQIVIAKQKLQQQYNFNPDTLPKVNIGDFFQSLARQGIGYNNADGSYIAPLSQSNSINEFLTTKPSSLDTQTINNTQNTLATGPGSSATTNNTSSVLPPSVSLQPGATGNEVKKLQDYLVSQGLMTQEQVNTGYGTYGPQTTAAVAALQQKLGVDNSSGIGFFGPKTISAINTSMSSGSSPSNSSSSGATTSSANNSALQSIISNFNLSTDQKSVIQKVYDLISTNNTAAADKVIAGFNAATQYSDPYFKAQTLIATDALSRALGANTGDLAFQEEKLRNTLADLTATTTAAKDQLSFQHAQELKNLETSYRSDLENTQQNLAALGKTSSSVRTKAENILNEQNQGLVASSNRQFNYQTGNLDRTLANTTRDTTQSLAYLTDKATQDRIAALRTAESQVGTTALQNLGYSNLLGTGGTPIGGEIPRKQVTDALSFSNSFVF